MSTEQDIADAKKWFWALVPLALIVVGIGVAVKLYLRPAELALEITNPSRMVYTYDWFFNQKASVEATEHKIEVAQTELESFESSVDDEAALDYNERQTLESLQGQARALKMHHADLVSDYNARSQMADKKIFKDGSLPDQLEHLD